TFHFYHLGPLPVAERSARFSRLTGGEMIRLFKHYVPHAVLLLGLFDLLLLGLAAELAWAFRASQIGIDPVSITGRAVLLASISVAVLRAMMAVGVHGSDSHRSLRFAGARLLVPVSLAILVLSFIDFVLGGDTFWRSTLLYTMALAILLLVLNRVVVGGLLGTSTFRRRVLVLGAGRRADRLRSLGARPECGFAIVGYVAMTEADRIVGEASARDAIPDLARFVETLGASEVVLALEERRNSLPLKDLLRIKTAGV